MNTKKPLTIIAKLSIFDVFNDPVVWPTTKVKELLIFFLFCLNTLQHDIEKWLNIL